MFSTDYPVLQSDETEEFMFATVALRIYLHIRSLRSPLSEQDMTPSVIHHKRPTDYYRGGITDQFLDNDDSFVFHPISKSSFLRYHLAQHSIIKGLLKEEDMLGGYAVTDYMRQLPDPLTVFAMYCSSPDGKYWTFRDIVTYVRASVFIPPRRLIELEGTPLLAASRLEFGGEWYGNIRDHPVPNFIGRLRNCMYLIWIAGVRRFVNWEHPTADSSQSGDIFSYIATPSTCKDDETPRCVWKTAKGFIQAEELAWRTSCALWKWEHDAIHTLQYTHIFDVDRLHITERPDDLVGITPLLEKRRPIKMIYVPATVRQLDKWLSVESGLFRHKALGKNYLATGDIPYSDTPWHPERNKGHLYAVNFEGAKGVVVSSDLVQDGPSPNGFRNIGIVDYTAPERSQVIEFIEHSGFFTGCPGRLFMHCAGGWGRTGMGLLLSIVALYDMEWDAAMVHMYRLYKRQSVEEVYHLLHESFIHTETMSDLFSALAKGDTTALSGIIDPSLDLKDPNILRQLLQIKAPLRDGSTLTYHSLIIPLFRVWVDEYCSELLQGGILTPEQLIKNRERSLYMGRPIPRSLGEWVDSDVYRSEVTSHPNRTYRNFRRHIKKLVRLSAVQQSLYLAREGANRKIETTH
jgi:hypothetical protein